MKNLNPHLSTLPKDQSRSNGLPLCSGGVFFMEKPKMVKDLGMYIKDGTSKRRRYWLCECPYCGKEFKALMYDINAGKIKSCGCQYRKHGFRSHPLYATYNNIKSRCYCKTSVSYKYYGMMGVIMCDEWLYNIESFITWCVCNGWADGLQIDRINSSGNYEPSNCRWATCSENAQNTRMIRSTNTSGFRGVSYRKDYKKWVSCVKLLGIRYHLGYFDTKEEAAMAYNNWVIEHGTRHTLNIL